MNKNYCVLIDLENAFFKMEEIFSELSKYGDTPIRILFGDFSSTKNSKWKEICKKFAITPLQTYNFTIGKNSADIALVITGMELLYTKPYLDGMIIVSSDSDYTALARKWRNEGKDVIGIGRHCTPESLKSSCNSFIYIENLLSEADALKEKDDVTKKVSNEIKDLVKNIILSNNGKAQISVLVDAINKVNPDFDVRTYGYRKAPDFFRGEFDFVNIKESKDNVYVAELKSTSITKDKIDQEVINIISKYRGKKMNMGELNKKLASKHIDLEQLGYSRIKKYLETIPNLSINGTDVMIKK